MVFVDSRPLDLRKRKISTPWNPWLTYSPAYASTAPLPVEPIVTVARLATGLAGLRLGRTGFAPAGRLIAFQKGLTSFHPRDPALTGRTRMTSAISHNRLNISRLWL